MTKRDRDLVRTAELASISNAHEAERLLRRVTSALRAYTRSGQLARVDALLAALRPATARSVTLVALVEAVQLAAVPASMTATSERFERELAEIDGAADTEHADVHERVEQIREQAERHGAEREGYRSRVERDRDFLARLAERRRGDH